MSAGDKPMVLIVGAGLGGLMLGALLERSGTPYTIFERATTVKPLGSAMVLGPSIFPILQQLGIYDDILAIGKYITRMHNFKEKETLEQMPDIDISPAKEFTGYGQYIVSRPKLYDLILKQVPAHKIHFGHRILDITEEDDKVTVHVANKGTFKGDIVVGADGAYSVVRQRMYEQLKAKGELPLSDQEDLPFSCTSLVGQTRALNPEDFPVVADAESQYNSIHGKDKPYSWHTFNTSQGTICWMVLEHLSEKTSKAAMEQRVKHATNSEWGDNPSQVMIEETRDLRIPLGGGKFGTMGDLYDATPKEIISKVMLEEKVFDTWYSRRFVLLGDACHKLHPAGGLGAVTSMHDAIALANLLYAMPAKTPSDITDIFEEYRKERHAAVLVAYRTSQRMGRIHIKGIVGTISSYFMTHMPMWLWRMMMQQTMCFRPQAGFIKSIELMGTLATVISPSEQKAKAIFDEQQQVHTAATV
ncbi:hypothetical protein EC991_003336 [Linnemannia zychae]|nr:hypothetical protein EC991_003336 [Linnemannia zychae]